MKQKVFNIILIVFFGVTSCDEKTEDPVYSPYISKVYDYCPAPGQFVNTMPEYKTGDSKSTLVEKAEKALIGEKSNTISLGGFGGYVIFGFDHTVENKSGLRDFRILGNAFWSEDNPNPNISKRGGSSEAGIIMVSYDENKNGIPDDKWYEIEGSEYNKSTKKYKITYHKPDPNKTPILNEKHPYATDVEYLFWEDNQGKSGYKIKNQYHTQNYFPEWVKEDKITFEGTLLPNNAIDESKDGTYWVQYSFDYGYADNTPNNDDESTIDIDWAVDENGNKVHLTGINFIKVYSGINQECGWLGESSTEVAGAIDLHLMGITIKTR